jgi:hypothetical protein
VHGLTIGDAEDPVKCLAAGSLLIGGLENSFFFCIDDICMSGVIVGIVV